MPPAGKAADEARRFACTSCGRCCDSGPEIELGEATTLAGNFVTSILFKAERLPISERSDGAVAWWQGQGSRIPLGAALAEKHRHLRRFASRRRADKHRGWQVFLTISAIADDFGRRQCPALVGNLCGIHAARPLSCRSVPLHYSRAPSVLRDYIDRFTATADYRCDTTTTAPVVLDGNTVMSPAIRQYRDRAIAVAKADRPWKDRLVWLMDDPARARIAELPTYAALIENSDCGHATLLPMIVAWRVAVDIGILDRTTFRDICRSQVGLIRAERQRSPGGQAPGDLLDALAVYEFELARGDAGGTRPAAAVPQS